MMCGGYGLPLPLRRLGVVANFLRARFKRFRSSAARKQQRRRKIGGLTRADMLHDRPSSS